MVDYSVAHRLKGHLNNVCSCDFSPDGALLATASYDTQVIIWDPHTGSKLKHLGYVPTASLRSRRGLTPPKVPIVLRTPDGAEQGSQSPINCPVVHIYVSLSTFCYKITQTPTTGVIALKRNKAAFDLVLQQMEDTVVPSYLFQFIKMSDQIDAAGWQKA